MQLCAPTLLAHEILNALHLAAKGKPGMPPWMAREAAQEGARLFTELQIALMEVGGIGARILEMALTYQRPSSYDVSYVALAKKLPTVVVTADERLLNAVSSQLSYVQPLWEVRLGS